MEGPAGVLYPSPRCKERPEGGNWARGFGNVSSSKLAQVANPTNSWSQLCARFLDPAEQLTVHSTQHAVATVAHGLATVPAMPTLCAVCSAHEGGHAGAQAAGP